MSESGPPERERPASIGDRPSQWKTEKIHNSEDVNSSLEKILSQLSEAEDVLADLALDFPDEFGALLWSSARLRISRRDIFNVLQRRRAE